MLSFEAQERLYYAVAGNIALNNCFNVKAIHAAVGNTDGSIRIPKIEGSAELNPRVPPECAPSCGCPCGTR